LLYTFSEETSLIPSRKLKNAPKPAKKLIVPAKVFVNGATLLARSAILNNPPF